MNSGTLPLLVALALCGCVSGPPSTSSGSLLGSPSTPPPAEPAPPQTPAQQRTEAASKLAVERQWLASWFKGTPVVIGQRADGAIFIDVPREFCFEPGRDAVKPALAAVLEKVAQSMRRLPIAELHLIAAPGDSGGNGAALGLQRATRVHEYLRSRGSVSAARLAKPSSATGAAVQLRIEAASPA
jgi:outer membrane protein OmpA-like peptidoglycan-associated protein